MFFWFVLGCAGELHPHGQSELWCCASLRPQRCAVPTLAPRLSIRLGCSRNAPSSGESRSRANTKSMAMLTKTNMLRQPHCRFGTLRPHLGERLLCLLLPGGLAKLLTHPNPLPWERTGGPKARQMEREGFNSCFRVCSATPTVPGWLKARVSLDTAPYWRFQSRLTLGPRRCTITALRPYSISAGNCRSEQ